MTVRSLLRLGAHPNIILKHMGPGDHPSGSPQTVHSRGGAPSTRISTLTRIKNKPFKPSGPKHLMDRINDIEQKSLPLMSSPGTFRGNDTMGAYGEWAGNDFVGWTPERVEWQDDVLAAHEQLQIEENGREPLYEKKALVMTGLPGSGKTFVLKHFAPVDLADYVMVNADDLKESIIFEDSPPSIGEDYHGMELSSVVHEESSAMAKRWERQLQLREANIALDITGANRNSTMKRIKALQDAGYEVSIVHVDVGPEQAWTSTVNRYQEGLGTELGGRPVPPKFVESMAVDSEIDVIDSHFESYRVAANGNWWHYKNYPIAKKPPELIASNEA